MAHVIIDYSKEEIEVIDSTKEEKKEPPKKCFRNELQKQLQIININGEIVTVYNGT